MEQYRDEEKSWKYTSALFNSGEKIYIGSTVDGDGNEIKIYTRENYEIKSVSQIMKEFSLTEKDVYAKYGQLLFQTAMPQSSIRPRVMEKVNELNIESELFSIEYVPKTGKNKGTLYEQFYKGKSFRLFAWLKDVSEVVDGVLCKKDLQGTYWDFVGETKNLTKEGNVIFPNGKKPERLIERVFTLATNQGDLVLDSFLGSGTTAAVAHKMGRRYIGIELGKHCYTHCKPRLEKVIEGEQGGISKAQKWQGGGGFKFYELAPSLIKTDAYGNKVIDDSIYHADLLAAAVAKINGCKYNPDKKVFWKQGICSENSYIFTTTEFITPEYLDKLSADLGFSDIVLVCCPAFESGLDGKYENIDLKKIPQSILDRCEYGKDNYNLNIIDTSEIEDEWEEGEEENDE